MDKIDNEFEITEKKVKEKTYHFFDTATKEYGYLADSINESFEVLDINSKVPNTAITAKNKVIELMHLFKRYNLSLFAGKIEAYSYIEKAQKELVGQPFVGNAIVVDIVKKLSASSDELKDLTLLSKQIIIDNINKAMPVAQGLNSMNPFKRIIARIKYNSLRDERILTPEEFATISTIYNAYKDLDDWLFNYNLRDNLIDSLMDYIKEIIITKDEANLIVKLDIEPTLKKLELEELIPELNNSIDTYYNNLNKPKNKKSWDIDEESLKKIAEELSNVVLQKIDSNDGLPTIIIKEIGNDDNSKE